MLYEVITYKDQPVIKESKLGMELKDDTDLTHDFNLKNTEQSAFDETWMPVWGETSKIRRNNFV